MSTYIIPQVLVYQELQTVPVTDINPLRAHVSGGHAYLARYAEDDEKALSLLGYYDPLAEACYSWPNKPVGATVDESYTRLFIDNALLEYYTSDIGGGDSHSTVSGKTSSVRSSVLNFKTNGAYAHSADFLDRGVKLGDIAKVRAVVGGDTYTLWSYVAAFVPEVVAAVIASATGDADNAATQTLPTGVATQTDGIVNCVTVDAVTTSSYAGLADGNINETYTVIVTESSVGGDPTTARLRVISASGNDDQTDVVPEDYDTPTEIGTRGLTVTFTLDAGLACSADPEEENISPNDLIVGQTWEVTCGQAFTAPTATSAGTYTGTENTTYVVTVTRGGLYAGATKPQITVTTTTGTDVSGPTNVTAAASAVAVGTKGVTIAFNQTGLRKGDRYFIPVTAASEGAIKTIKLGHNFAEEVIDAGPTEVGLTLYIKADVEIPANREDFAPLTNWTQSSTEFCTQSGIVAYDSSWTDDGVQQPLSVVSDEDHNYGKMYLEYRAWRSDLCNDIYAVSDVGQLDDAIPGPLHPDNELKWGVYCALQNSAGQEVMFTSVCDPNDDDSWSTVLELLDGRSDCYGLVPLTRDTTVLNLFAAHVGGQSSAETGRWKVLWVNLDGISEKVLVNAATSSDEEVVLATVTDDPETSGTQYTYLRVPGGNSDFSENGVVAGDIVRLGYTTDGFGNTTYTEVVIEEVVNETTLRLATALNAAINTPQKIEVWRNLTPNQEAAEIAATNSYNSRRVRAVWPDTVGAGDYTFPGYHLCAALAGLVSGVVPHQGLTNLEITGFTDLSRSTKHFNKTQLNTLAVGGVWVVTQDPQNGGVFTRHAVTTGDYDDINAREEIITRNLDSISYFFSDLLAPFIGISNVTPSTIATINAYLLSGIQELVGRNFVRRLGGQLISGEIVEVRQHSILKDRIVVTINLTLPYALNNIELHLVA